MLLYMIVEVLNDCPSIDYERLMRLSYRNRLVASGCILRNESPNGTVTTFRDAYNANRLALVSIANRLLSSAAQLPVPNVLTELQSAMALLSLPTPAPVVNPAGSLSVYPTNLLHVIALDDQFDEIYTTVSATNHVAYNPTIIADANALVYDR